MSNEKTEITDAVRSVVKKLIEIHIEQEQFLILLEEMGMTVHRIFRPELIDLAMDLCGVPKDTTAPIDLNDTHPDDYPDWLYCRDWFYEELDLLRQSKYSVEQFIEVLLTGKSLQELYG